MAASLVAVTPLASQVATEAAQRAVRNIETTLVDSSIFNIPFNLLQEIVNIPNSEVDAMTYAAQSLFNSGPWFVVSATNLWGVDQGDPSHFMSVTNFLVPFEGLSGINAPETDFAGGLGQQLWGLVATTLPTSAGCDAFDCLPVSPTSPVTGISGLDWFIRLNDIATGQQEFPLFDNWFKVGLNELWPNSPGGGYFFDPAGPGSFDPSGPAYTIFPNIPGTVGDGNLYPWAGETYTLQPWVPFENWINGLMEDPDYSNFQIPSMEEAGRALQSLAAASAVFTPFTPGSPFCPGECTIITDNNLDYPDLVRYIDQAWPGNETIGAWLGAYDNGMANVPTEEQIARSIEILQQGFWSFGNPSPEPGTGPDYTETVAQWYQFWTSLGFDPSNNPVTADFSTDLAALTNVLGPEQLTEDWAALAASFAPEQLADDWAGLLGSFDFASFSADWASALAG
ncbi:hypothetical protein [Mycobacterium sp.]|uniref:hypothetical protein n=1 Tax=Mycobacterium sp. TaxID=1785 RepID=UPI003D0CB24A